MEIDGIKTEVSYAVLKRGQVTVEIFDRLHHPIGNATDFGVFAFLGEGPKQLVVEQSTPRNWSHQIVQLAPNFQVIFDSQRWFVDGELILVDVNQDGVFEFSKMVTILYDFHGLPIAESPLIPILFAFDRRGNVYIPANHLFPEYALKGIEDELKSLDRSRARTYLAAVLRVLMRYIYAGRRDEGWAFYEREYTLADKNLIKSEITSKLVSEPVYRFIYG